MKFRKGNDTVDAVEPRVKTRKPVLGILSIIIAAVSMLPMLGIASLVGLVLGIVAFFREKRTFALLGIILSGASLAVSPTAWALLASLWIGVYCNVADCGKIISQGVQKTLENPKNQQMVQEFANNAIQTSAFVQFPPEWKDMNYDQNPERAAQDFYANANFHLRGYRAAEGYASVLLHGFWDKEPNEPINDFITRNVDSLRAKHPAIQITPMEDATIHNGGDTALNIAHLRILSDGTGHEEAVAFVDGGHKVFTLILAAPSRDELMKAWAIYSDILINNVSFKAGEPNKPMQAPPPPATSADQPSI